MPERLRVYHVRVITEGDAFHPDPTPELARILRQLADDLESFQDPTRVQLRDVNGNGCGYAGLLRESVR